MKIPKKPWGHTSALGKDDFRNDVLGNKVMKKYEDAEKLKDEKKLYRTSRYILYIVKIVKANLTTFEVPIKWLLTMLSIGSLKNPNNIAPCNSSSPDSLSQLFNL